MSADFDNTTKSLDRKRPIHRINAPHYDETRKPPTGEGLNCGCRDYENMRERGFRAVPAELGALYGLIPSWVPVEREFNPSDPSTWHALPEIEYEVEGILEESHQAGSDVPWTQWHFWYDWNFMLVPAKGYEYLRGLGNAPRLIECEWDCGAFGDYDFGSSRPTPDDPGPMFGRNHDWAWPVGGEYIWIAGRWIYDCGHPDSKRLVHTELHPCKAVASARWEAVKFDENEQPVPAIQFMFFACVDGGYISPFPLNDRDYEFIVDLPDSPPDDRTYPIGSLPKYALNTLVLRPRLLVKFDYKPFANAHGPTAQPEQAGEREVFPHPVIEFLPARGGVPEQVKLRVPLTKLPSTTHSYGVIASLGWYDPERKLEKKVKRVSVSLDYLVVDEGFPSAPSEGREDQWQMKFGVNGRWFAKTFTVTHQGQKITLEFNVDLALAEDDQIAINVYGIRPTINATMFERAPDQRTFTDGGVPLRWENLDQGDDGRAVDVWNQLRNAGLIELLREQALVSGENVGREQINPGRAPKDPGNDTPNPLTVLELKKTKPGSTLDCHLTGGLSTTGRFPSADYTLHYRVRYDDI